MLIRSFPTIQRRILSTMPIASGELYEFFTPWTNTLEALTAIQGVLALTNKGGNFQCRLAIQTASLTTDDLNAPATLASPYNAQISTEGLLTWFRFDPNAAGNGDIDAAAYFRLGVAHSISGGGSTPSQGEVEFQGLCWR
jgi:hypothetical protein